MERLQCLLSWKHKDAVQRTAAAAVLARGIHGPVVTPDLS